MSSNTQILIDALKKIYHHSDQTLLDEHPNSIGYIAREAIASYNEFSLLHKTDTVTTDNTQYNKSNAEVEIVYVAVDVEKELPPYPQIVVVLLDGRIPMMAQIRPSENGHEWWTLGMSQATRLEENKKCVTHWLKRKK